MLAFIACGASVARAQADWSTEYRLKAGFLTRFPEFVRWPASAWQFRNTLSICVASPSPFGNTLTDLTDRGAIDGHPLAVRVIDPWTSPTNCHVLYVRLDQPGGADLVARVADQPVLTVTEGPPGVPRTGVISLRVVANKVRFDIDLHAARKAGLVLNAQLIRLALNVKGSE